MAVSELSSLIASVEQHPSTLENSTPHRRRKIIRGDQKIRSAGASQNQGTRFASISTPYFSSTTSLSGRPRLPSEQSKTSKRRKSPSLLRSCKRFATKHTWAIPLVLLLAFISLYAINPTESNIIHRFIFLSYKQQSPEGDADHNAPPHYGKGLWDIAFVSFYVIVLSFTREFIMQELLRPLARFCGIYSRGKQFRFMEQMYTAIYFSVMGSAGLYVMRKTPVWYFNTRGMYESFPHKTHDADFKFYYLFQAAYWAQQAIVMLLGLEKPRKDYKELVAHHIITLTLITLSYRFHFTYLGISIYITHDISDFFLALSKSLHYINCPVVELYFGSSIVSWIYLRHYQNLRIIYSLFTEFKTVGPYELSWETQQYKCLLSNVITLGLLLMLQAINLFWLYCLLRSAFRFLVYNIAKDDRSEAEESEIEELQRQNAEKLQLLNGNGLDNGNPGSIAEVTSNGTAVPPTKRKGRSARRRAAP